MLRVRRPKKHFAAALAGLLLGAAPFAVRAQELITQKVLSLDLAAGMAQAALAACRANGDHVVVTVLDDRGMVKVLLRDDGTGPQSVDTSRRKAFTALAFRGPSSEQAKAWAAQKNPNIGPDRVALAGGVPVKVGNEVIGAIGVAGSRSLDGGSKDEACAQAGVSKYAGKLK